MCIYRFAKGEYFTAQFTFEYVGDEKYCLGVKGSYKKYTKDRVFTIRKETTDETTPFSIGYCIQIANYKVQPTDGKQFSVLTGLPTIPLEPIPIWSEFPDAMEKLIVELQKKYGRQHSCIEQWRAWQRKLPNSSSVQEFCSKQPLRIPLKDELFGPILALTDSTSAHSKQRKRAAPQERTFNGKRIREAYSGDYIRHKGNKGLAPPPLVAYQAGAIVDDSDLVKDVEYMKAKEVWSKCDVSKVTKTMLQEAIDTINKTNGIRKLSKNGNKEKLLYAINVYYQNIRL